MKNLNSQFWDNYAGGIRKHYRSKYISEYHKYENEEIFQEWCYPLQDKKILLTDIFNEAFDRDELPDNFWKPGVDIIGIDIAKSVVEKFHKRFPSHRKLVCDVRSLPFKDSEFDIVLSPSTLDHFPQTDLEISLQEIRRVLKKEGMLILYLHNKYNAFFHYYQMKMRRLYPFPMELYSKNQIIKILNKHQFSIFECTVTGHVLFPDLYPLILFYLKRLNMLKIYYFLIKTMYSFRKLRRKKTKYLTGTFITIKATK